MSGFMTLLVLAAACWLVRLTFIVFLPAERLPAQVTAALGQVAPAVLAALVSVDAVGLAREGTAGAGLLSLTCMGVIAAVARWRPNLAMSAGLGLGAALLLDLVVLP